MGATLSESLFPALQKFPFPVALQVFTATEVLGSFGDTHKSYHWASITKIATAVATLELVEQERLDLEQPLGPPGASLRHLLAHTSGLSFSSDTMVARPGARRVYSNRNYELIGQEIRSVTGLGVADWMEKLILYPLGMGYTWMQGSAADGLFGPLDELRLFGQELLKPTLLQPATFSQMTRVQFPGTLGVLPGFGRQEDNTWGLGPEIRGNKSPHWTGPESSPQTFGHFGQAGSFLWVDPTREVAAAFLGSQRFGDIHAELWPELNTQILRAL